jgi:Cu2+-containing amine oxidase
LANHRYIQAAGGFMPYWRNKFAYPLMYNVSGSLHNHLIAWKVDLDVAGRSNSVNMHTIGVGGARANAPMCGKGVGRSGDMPGG